MSTWRKVQVGDRLREIQSGETWEVIGVSGVDLGYSGTLRLRRDGDEFSAYFDVVGEPGGEQGVATVIDEFDDSTHGYWDWVE